MVVPQTVDFKKIGVRIKQLRVQHGWSQSELAHMVGCSDNHMSHIETGTKKISLSLLLKFSFVFETSIDYFLLDTPFARPDAVISFDLARKLEDCEPQTLLAINQTIDSFLELQRAFHNDI